MQTGPCNNLSVAYSCRYWPMCWSMPQWVAPILRAVQESPCRAPVCPYLLFPAWLPAVLQTSCTDSWCALLLLVSVSRRACCGEMREITAYASRMSWFATPSVITHSGMKEKIEWREEDNRERRAKREERQKGLGQTRGA